MIVMPTFRVPVGIENPLRRGHVVELEGVGPRITAAA